MKIGIVGARDFPQIQLVEWFIRDLPSNVTVISGGAKGVDEAAAHFALERGLEVIEHFPDLSECNHRHEFTKAYYSRNERIVRESDLIVAFTGKDTGGTWNTITTAKRLGVPVKVVRPSCFFPNSPNKEDEKEPQEQVETTDATQAKAEPKPLDEETMGRPRPDSYAIRAVSLGSYCLHLRRYLTGEQWADFVVTKDDNPSKLGEVIGAEMLQWFVKHERMGCLHAVTPPPRSVRNLGKEHPMEIACDIVAAGLGCDSARLFKPWEKTSRGAHANKPTLAIADDAAKYVGKVVWVLDDVVTTRHTLTASVRGLQSIQIHSHGLGYLLMA